MVFFYELALSFVLVGRNFWLFQWSYVQRPIPSRGGASFQPAKRHPLMWNKLFPSAGVAKLWIGHVGLHNTHTHAQRDTHKKNACHTETSAQCASLFVCLFVGQELLMTNDLLTTQEDEQESMYREQMAGVCVCA